MSCDMENKDLRERLSCIIQNNLGKDCRKQIEEIEKLGIDIRLIEEIQHPFCPKK